ncbi:uncharacterized protein [Palaemon carinicauda]|uniref:uncharacterized protein n=1 Tax=Palaemon carinicauda TaxID=392227 RepID=UPI0035B669CD
MSVLTDTPMEGTTERNKKRRTMLTRRKTSSTVATSTVASDTTPTTEVNLKDESSIVMVPDADPVDDVAHRGVGGGGGGDKLSTSDTEEFILSVEGQSTGTRRHQSFIVFTVGQEKDLAVGLEGHNLLYDKVDLEYRNKPRKDRVKKEKGDSMVPPVSPQDLGRWIRSRRTRYGKLSKSKSGDGNPRIQSERDKWILTLFSFLGRHIQRSQQPKTLGPKESTATACLPTTPPPTCDVVEVGRHFLSPTPSSSSFAGTSPICTEDLILEKVFNCHQQVVS